MLSCVLVLLTTQAVEQHKRQGALLGPDSAGVVLVHSPLEMLLLALDVVQTVQARSIKPFHAVITQSGGNQVIHYIAIPYVSKISNQWSSCDGIWPAYTGLRGPICLTPTGY
jgi:hypothetical protein